MTEVGSEKTLLTVVSEDDSQFYCRASNRYGAQNSSVAQIDVICKSSKKKTKKKPDIHGQSHQHLWFLLSSSSKGNYGCCQQRRRRGGGRRRGSALPKPSQPACEQLHLVQGRARGRGGGAISAPRQRGAEPGRPLPLQRCQPAGRDCFTPDPAGRSV